MSRSPQESGAAALIDKAPSAVAKLRAMSMLASALTCGEVTAIAARYFSKAPKAGLMASLVMQLENPVAPQPPVLVTVPDAAPAAARGELATGAAADGTAPGGAAADGADPAVGRERRLLQNLRGEDDGASEADGESEEEAPMESKEEAPVESEHEREDGREDGALGAAESEQRAEEGNEDVLEASAQASEEGSEEEDGDGLGAGSMGRGRRVRMPAPKCR